MVPMLLRRNQFASGSLAALQRHPWPASRRTL
jgi:hypothetical protein